MKNNKQVTISEEDVCSECGHKRIEHDKNGCNHGRWGRGGYPCLCTKFKIKDKEFKS